MSNMARKNRGRTVALRNGKPIDGDGWDEVMRDPTSMFIPLNHQYTYVMTMIEQAVTHHRLTMPEMRFVEGGVALQFRSREEAARFREISVTMPSVQITSD